MARLPKRAHHQSNAPEAADKTFATPPAIARDFLLEVIGFGLLRCVIRVEVKFTTDDAFDDRRDLHRDKLRETFIDFFFIGRQQ